MNINIIGKGIPKREQKTYPVYPPAFSRWLFCRNKLWLCIQKHLWNNLPLLRNFTGLVGSFSRSTEICHPSASYVLVSPCGAFLLLPYKTIDKQKGRLVDYSTFRGNILYFVLN